MPEFFAGDADKHIDVFIQDSSSTVGDGLAGLVYNTSGLKCYYRMGATGTVTPLTLAPQTVGGAHSDGGFVELDATNMKGAYRLDLSDTIIASEGQVTLYLYGATNMAPCIVRLLVRSATRGACGTALPNAAADAPGGLPISDAGGLDLDTRLDAAISSRLAPTTAGRTLDVTATGAAGIDWGNVENPTTAVGLTGTTVALTAAYEAAKDAASAGDVAAVAAALAVVDDLVDDLETRLTAVRAAYLDKLNISGNVASSGEVTSIQNNTRVVRVVPTVIERPDSGTTTYRVELLLYDDVGNMEAPDSAPTLDLVDQGGTDLSARLDSATGTLVSTGRYRWIYTASSTDDLEQLVWTFSVIEGGATRLYGNTSLIVDTTAADFTASDRSKLDAIHGKLPSRNYLAGSTAATGAVVTADIGLAAADLDSQLDNLASELNTVKTNIGTPVDTDIATDIANVQTGVTSLLSRITATLFSGITSLAQWLGLIAGKQTGNSTARTELRATGAGSGTYDETTDSTQAIRDRGDAAWTTGGGGGGGTDVNVVSVNGLPVDTGQINITVVNSGTVQNGTLILYRSADYSNANGNTIHFSDVANIDGAEELYLTIVDNQAEAAVTGLSRVESFDFDELAETADFEATATIMNITPGAHYAFVVERKVGTEYNPILWGPCTIKANNRTFPA